MIGSWEEDEQGHADIKHGRGYFSAPQCAVQPAFALDRDEAADGHARFFDEKQDQHDGRERIADDDQKQQGELQELIGDRIDDLSGLGDHMVFPGDEAVQEVREFHDAQDQCGGQIVRRRLSLKVGISEDGDHPDPEITKQIGDGEQLFEVHGLRLLSCKK